MKGCVPVQKNISIQRGSLTQNFIRLAPENKRPRNLKYAPSQNAYLKRTLFAENGACTFLLITHNHQMARALSCSQPDGACLVSVDLASTLKLQVNKVLLPAPIGPIYKGFKKLQEVDKACQLPNFFLLREKRTPRAVHGLMQEAGGRPNEASIRQFRQSGSKAFTSL